MIKDEKLGLKIAESDEEAFWEENVQACEKRIKNFEDALKFEHAILPTLKNELENAGKDTKESK